MGRVCRSCVGDFKSETVCDLERETRDLETSSMGRGNVWDGDAGRQIQGRTGRGCEWLLQKSEVNAMSVTFLVNMFW